MNETCIVNYASGSPDSLFRRGQRRLVEECKAVGYEGDFLLFNDEKFLFCPPHSQVPYAFKPHAMKVAASMGYRFLLWCDCSVFPIRPLDIAFEIMRELGYMFLMCGWKAGEWCSDAALVTLGVSRAEALTMDQLIGGCQGLDLDSPKARAYLDRWYELSRDGITFPGAWTNENGQVSADKRVLGHRHDQVAASIIAWKLGMRDFKPGLLLYDETGKTPLSKMTLFVVKSA